MVELTSVGLLIRLAGLIVTLFCGCLLYYSLLVFVIVQCYYFGFIDWFWVPRVWFLVDYCLCVLCWFCLIIVFVILVGWVWFDSLAFMSLAFDGGSWFVGFRWRRLGVWCLIGCWGCIVLLVS